MHTQNDPAVAAIAYVLDHPNDDPVEFLRLWNEGCFTELRQEWDDIPDDVFDGAEYGFVRKS